MNKQNNTLSVRARRIGVRLCQILIVVLGLHSANVLADALTDRVAAALNHHSPTLQATIHSDDEIRLTTPVGPVTVYLDRVRGECQKRPDACDATIQNLVAGIAATSDSPDTMKFNADRVYPVVRPAKSVQAMQETLGGDMSRLYVSRPYISGAVLLYAVDTPTAIRFVNTRDLEHAGLTLETLDQIARAHVSRLSPLRFQPMEKAPGLWVGISNDGYATSRLFDPKFWDALEALAGGSVAVALPTRDWLLAARLDNPEAISNLRSVAARIVAGEPTAVTSALVRRDGVSWREVAP